MKHAGESDGGKTGVWRNAPRFSDLIGRKMVGYSPPLLRRGEERRKMRFFLREKDRVTVFITF